VRLSSRPNVSLASARSNNLESPITRRGRPVAVLGPAKRTVQKSPRNRWAHKGKIVGDIVNKDTSALWEVAGRE
jgi:antitoxin (DNA-binding transcriptional repressor) of toxin-antitoxin stability system